MDIEEKVVVAEEEPKKKKEEYVTVNCKLLNVRVKPDITSAKVMQVSEGTQLLKLGTAKKGEWIKVPDGYVMAEFVS